MTRPSPRNGLSDPMLLKGGTPFIDSVNHNLIQPEIRNEGESAIGGVPRPVGMGRILTVWHHPGAALVL